MSYADNAQKYIDAGWTSPMPLPKGQKYPPPEHSTGNHPDITLAQIGEWVEESNPNANIALRMPRGKDWEIIGIDIDHHDTKRGNDTILKAESTHGKLPDSFSCSSRGSANRHGIHFYRVPRGIKWDGQIGPSVEVIQRTHRYAVVAPSVVEGREYTWYDADGDEWDMGIPKVSTLPDLPQAWIDAFSKGAAVDRKPIAEEDRIGASADAMKWLEAEIPGYHSGRSSVMHKASDFDSCVEQGVGGAHDMLTARVHECVRLGCEGHHGLKEALDEVLRAFLHVVLGHADGETRRSESAAYGEWDRSLIGVVEKLMSDVADDLVMISNLSGFGPEDEEEVDALEATFRDAISKRPETVDPEEFPANDYGHGQMIAEYWGRNLRSISESMKDWILWADDQSRWERLPSERLYHRVALPAVHDRLEKAAVSVEELADRIRKSGEDEEAVKEYARAKAIRDRSVSCGNKIKLESMLTVARTERGVPISWAKFDSDDFKTGVSNGVIDLNEAAKADKPTEVPLGSLVRVAKFDDYVSLNTDVAFDIRAESKAWNFYLHTFLPDTVYRRFVQKVMGYCLLGNNSERLLVFLQGGTSTGKSTLLEAVMGATGDYSTVVNVNEIFRERHDGGPNPGLVQALSRRIITASEIGQHHQLHADVIKRMTGGDHLSARELYSNTMVGRVPAFTPVIATNSMPKIKDGDSALWRRLLVLPFDHQIKDASNKHKKLTESKEAMEAVLLWLVEGALMYLEEGLDQSTWPDQCVTRAKEFVAGTSDFQAFLSSCTQEDPESGVEQEKLYKYYRAWAASESIPEKEWLTKTGFTKAMTSNGFKVKRTSRTVDGTREDLRLYAGLRAEKG